MKPTRNELLRQNRLARLALEVVFREMDLRTLEQFRAFVKVKAALAVMRQRPPRPASSRKNHP